MKRIAIISNGFVVNVALYADDGELLSNEMLEQDAIQQGLPWRLPEGDAPPPDYYGFYQELLVSTIYAALLNQEATAQLARALAVFVSAIQDALDGRINQPALQGAIWLLLSNLTLQPEHVQELHSLMTRHRLDSVYSLSTTQEYFPSHPTGNPEP